jgi:hypothetical protein
LRYVSGACVECAKATLRRSRAANPERTKAQKKKDYAKSKLNPVAVENKRVAQSRYYERNKQKILSFCQDWRARHPGIQREYSKVFRETNPGAKNADTARRRSDKLRRTPDWLSDDDKWMIRQAYELAAIRTRLFGFSWHVDHILPLRGKRVSGLHVPTNLQVIPAEENIRKGAN